MVRLDVALSKALDNGVSVNELKFLPSSRPDLRGHDREGSEEASREGVKNPRFEEGTGRDWKILISFFYIDLEPLRRRLPAGESWLEGGAVKPKAVESGSSLNP